MRSQICDDGRKRIMAKVLVPITVEEITMYALRQVCTNKDPFKVINDSNKRQIFDLAKKGLYNYGRHEPMEHIEKEFDPIKVEGLVSAVRDKFPELQDETTVVGD